MRVLCMRMHEFMCKCVCVCVSVLASVCVSIVLTECGVWGVCVCV
jgi:hypothetical protein